MKKFTLLSRQQVWGRKKIDVIKKRGVKAAITDFAIILGGRVCKETVDGSESLEKRTGVYWTRTRENLKNAEGIKYWGYTVAKNGNRRMSLLQDQTISVRPVISFSSINEIPTNGDKPKIAEDGIHEVEYGYYPQKIAPKDLQKTLERLYRAEKLEKTGNSYSILERDSKKDYSVVKKSEFFLNGKKYVRMGSYNSPYSLMPKFSDGISYGNKEYAWFEVSPIKWLIDEKAGIMTTEKIIFSGVPFELDCKKAAIDNPETRFDRSYIYNFMNEYLRRDLEQTRKEIVQPMYVEKRKTRLQRLNPDKTDPQDRSKMTDTEIIKDWIDAGESVLLRGPSGIGKTDRIKRLYPDLIYIKLTNNMFPEKVVGSVNLQTGESIPPDYAKTAILQEATEEEKKEIEENIQNIYDIADEIYERSKESDKKIVIMLDELLNVKPAVQSLVYTLVLNRMVEIGKGLKLPDNVVIVATGNQRKYSNVAQDLAEPLEKRFNHILDMEPKVGEWITEYAIPNKVHPAVIGYILSKYNTSGKSERLEDIGYFYEEPEVGEEHLDSNGCKGRTNDPRGWVSISNTLYNFEENLKAGKYEGKDVEDIIKRSIGSKLRMEWAEEFFDYYNLPTLTPEEVVKGMGEGYTIEDLPLDINERFAYMTALITADESQVEACRNFIRKYCDPEYLAVYDIYWAGNDERRMEKISELQEMFLALHEGKEAKEYATEGLEAYENIGKMYSLSKEPREETRGEEK